MTAFRQASMLRSGQRFTAPEVVLQGTLRVTDPAAFRALHEGDRPGEGLRVRPPAPAPGGPGTALLNLRKKSRFALRAGALFDIVRPGP